MSKHVAPHRWADAFAGQVTSAERAEMDAHAADCPRCARARARVQSASDTFPVLRQAPPPELGWDGVRARIHWTISKAKRNTESHPKVARRPWLPILIAGTAIASGVGVYALTRAPAPRVAMHAPTAHAPEPVAKPTALTALVSRLAGDVMIDGAKVSDAFAKPLGAGTVLATGNGRIDVQFGEASAFALGPRSTLELRSFDAETIALVVDGTVDLEVAPRTKHQRFFVIAGDRTIEVRGTRFAVKHDADGTLVSCQHGLVAVTDTTIGAAGKAQELDVGTARKAFVPAQHAVSEAHAVPLTADELATLVTATPWSTPGWNPDLAAHTAPLAITTAAPHRAVRVDGIELGTAPFEMRVAPGRHTIESTDAAGRFRRAGWVDVAVGAHDAHFEAPPIEEAPLPASPTAAIAARKHQFASHLDRPRLQQCTRRLAKSGLTDTFVQIEITVDAGGAVDVLNIIDTDLPADTASCVHDALAETKFPAGTAATWREKLTL